MILSAIVVATLLCSQTGDTLELRINEERTISGENVKSVSVGNPGIAQVKISEDQNTLIVGGIAPGETTLTVLYRGGERRTLRVLVTAIDVVRVVDEINQMTRGIEGVSVSALGRDRVRIDGFAYSERDLERIKKIAASYGPAVINLVELDRLYVRTGKAIELEFNFAELRRSDGGRWGIDWNNGQIGVSADGRFGGSILKTNDPSAADVTDSLLNYAAVGRIAVTLNYLTAKGWGTVYDTHRVVVMDGTEAKYSAGGQLNVVVSGLNSGELRTIPFGTIVRATPRIGRSNLVDLRLEAEVSTLDQSTIVTGVPALRSNRISTDVTVELGQSIVLSGLITRQDATAVRGIVGLNNIPILGYLFKSEDFLQDRTESVVFITPRLVDNATGRTQIERVLQSVREAVDD